MDDSNFKGKSRCLNFARSVVFCKEDYQIREQMNAVTAFLDLSSVYGSALNETEFLRGKRKVSMVESHASVRRSR